MSVPPSKRRKLLQDLVDGCDQGGEVDYDSSAASNTEESVDGVLSTAPTTPSHSGGRCKRYLCTYDGCEKSFTRPCRLEEHVRSHTNERPFACEEDGCGKRFLRAAHLRQHIKSAHSGVRDHQCTVPGCGKGFATGTRLRRHDAAAHGDECERRQYRCTDFPGCGAVFRKHGTLQRHVVTAHLGGKAFLCGEPVTGSDGPQGARCERGFDTAARLKAHRTKEHSGKRFWCSICEDDEAGTGPGFATHSMLHSHVREAHPPICQHCGRHFASGRGLRSHMDAVHVLDVGDAYEVESQQQQQQRLRVFVCEADECGSIFSRKSNLAVHVSTVHRHERRFVCAAADEVVGWTGEGACGATFSAKASLVQHVRRRHVGAARGRPGRAASALERLTGGTAPAAEAEAEAEAADADADEADRAFDAELAEAGWLASHG